MASLKAPRPHVPLTVQWPLLYANEELVGQGTLLNLSHCECQVGECQVAGTLPVAAGMVLKLWISPKHRDDAIYVEEARVLWARANEFGLELCQVDVEDHEWLLSFLGSHRISGEVSR